MIRKAFPVGRAINRPRFIYPWTVIWVICVVSSGVSVKIEAVWHLWAALFFLNLIGRLCKLEANGHSCRRADAAPRSDYRSPGGFFSPFGLQAASCRRADAAPHSDYRPHSD